MFFIRLLFSPVDSPLHHVTFSHKQCENIYASDMDAAVSSQAHLQAEMISPAAPHSPHLLLPIAKTEIIFSARLSDI